ncbi:MAG: hypothetical protein H7125_17310 [Proteobacteria bacterium]|nr:hypothetical protein [Burkholderiales bacterium]
MGARRFSLRHGARIDYIHAMSPRAAFFWSFYGFFSPLAEGLDRRC